MDESPSHNQKLVQHSKGESVSKTMNEIANLSTAAHDLLQGAGSMPDATHRNRVFKTIKKLLDRIDAAADDMATTAAIKSVVDSGKQAPAPVAAFTITMEELLGCNIALLGLPHRVAKALVTDRRFTIGEVCDLGRQQLVDHPSIGEGGAELVESALGRYGLSIAA